MRTRISSLSIAALSTAFACLATPANADTDGYFSIAWGTRAKGLGGVATAWPHDSLAPSFNPAALARMGKRFDADVALFSPLRSYNVDGAPTGPGSFLPGEVKSDRNYFVIPNVGYSAPVKNGGVVGLCAYGNGGMNTTWPGANGGFGVFGGGKTGVNLEQLFLNGTYSQPVSATTSLGISLIWVRQTFSASGLQPLSPASSTISNNGTEVSTGLGGRIGVLTNLGRALDFGASWQPKIKMSHFKQYATLFADNGNFDIPETYSLGLAQQLDRGRKIGVEMRTIKYSSVPSVGNPFSNIVNGLGSPNGPGFGWRDMKAYKLGYEWQASKDLTWRAGVGYGRQPIPSSEVLFNILAPGVVEWHYATGFSKELGKGRSLSASFTFSPNKTVSGHNPNDPTQTISLKMREYELAIGYSVKL